MTRQLVGRAAVAIGSMFAGGAVHHACSPDLTVPVVPSLASPPHTPPDGAGFEAASSFQGARPGFVFKSGDAGLGYYPDARQSG